MSSITLRDVTLLAPDPLFRNLSFTLGDGDRLGLVAGNGAGKSSLLRCLAGEAEPSAGSITRARGLRAVLVAQDVPGRLLDLPLAEAIRRALPPAERTALEWRVGLVLDAFDTPDALRERPLRALSGGWQRLALLARAWIADPDVLLLDEPTNHLDLAKIEWLEGWIAAQRIPMVIASHDRQFLDACTTHTLFLRPVESRLHAHPYGRARALLEAEDAAAASRLAREGAEAARLRRSAAALRNIGVNSHSDAAQKKSAQLRARAEAIEQRLEAPALPRAGALRLASRGSHARVMLAMEDVTIATPTGLPLFRTGRQTIFQGDRILLTGPNGAGKTRFLALLRQAIGQGEGPCDAAGLAGLRPSPSIVAGVVEQQMGQLPAAETPHRYITTRFAQADQPARRLLAAAGLAPDRQARPIAQLSPGQKARLGLLALRLAAPNFWLLDEPTNHLDIPGQEALEREILAHEASAVMVSHDRRFVQAVATRIWRIEGGRLVEAGLRRPWPGRIALAPSIR